MRKKSIFMTALFTIFMWTMPATAQERVGNTVIENPQFSVNNTNSITIDKVELLPDSTRLHMTAYHSPKSWVVINRETYIRVNGEKLIMTSAEGITPDKKFYSDETNQTHFVLNFPAVPADAQTLDFFESDCEDCFKIWDVALTPESSQQIAVSTPIDIQNWAEIPDDGQPLVTPAWKSGKAKIKGFIRGFKPEMGKDLTLYYDNAVTGIQEMHGTEVKPDGTFSLDVPIATTDADVFMRILNRTISLSFLIAAEKETEIYVDKVAEAHQKVRNKALKINQKQTIFYRGAHADINNALLSKEVKSFNTSIPYEKYMKEIVNMSIDEYKAYQMDFYQNQMKELEKKDLPTKIKEYLGIRLKQYICHQLFLGDHYLESAFRTKNKLGRKDKLDGYNVPVFTEKYYSFLNELDMNNPKNLLCSMYQNNVNNCKFISYNLFDYNTLIHKTTAKELLKLKTLSREEKKMLKKISNIKNAQEFNAILDENPDSLWGKIQEKHQFYKVMGEQVIELRKNTLSKLMDTEKSNVLDLMVAQMMSAPLEEKMLIPDENIQKIEQLENPFFARYIKEKNDELIAHLEAQKQRGGYTIHKAGESMGEALLTDIVQQFKGKVIFIDVWATWCGPCRSAMTRFEPAKKELGEKGVVFVYLTDHTSPKEAWKNMIIDIKGEHFRLTNAQLNSLKLLFNFNGVPSYLIIDKEGKVVYSHVGFEGNAKITELLTKELEK